MKTNAWIAWVLLVAAWVGLGVFVLVRIPEPVCDPRDPTLAVRLAQNAGTKEVGVVYLNWENARMTRVYLDEWLHRYGKCP